MAINPKLISVKTASELPTAAPTSTGQFFFFEGNEMKKSPMTDIYDKVSSAYMGIATTSTTPPPTGAYWYRVNAPGTYMGITVTTTDLNSNDVFIEVKNNVATKRMRAFTVSTSTAKIEMWSAKVFTSGSQVIYEEQIYEANASTVAGDVPGVASVWVKRVGGVDITNIIDSNNTEEAVSGKAVYDFLIENKKDDVILESLDNTDFTFDGYLDKNGNVISNTGWKTTDFIPVSEGNQINFSLYGSRTSATPIYAVFFYDENQQKVIGLDLFPENTAYYTLLYSKSIIAPSNGFIRICNRVFNGLTDYSVEITKSPQLFTTPEEIGVIPDEIKKSYITEDKKNQAWTNGEFMGVPPRLVANANAKYLKIPMKKGEGIDYRGRFLQGVNSTLFVSSAGNIVGNIVGKTHNTDIEHPSQLIATSDGDFYINQNLTHPIPTVLNHYKFDEIEGEKTLVNYIDEKFSISKEGTAVNVPVLISTPNAVQLLTSQIVGVSKFNENVIANVGYSLSNLIPVNKADVIYYSGVIGDHGVGLYSGENKLISKLANNPQSLLTVTNMRIEIPVSGFLIISSSNSTPSTLKIAPAIYEQIDFQNIEAGAVSTTTKTYIELNKPNSMWKVDLIGTLPTGVDITKSMDVEFSENGTVFLKTKGEFTFQGQSSLTNPKKNYTFDVLNADGDDLKLKIGDMIATDSFHLKGFQKDISLTRDYLTSRMWYNIRKAGAFPDNRIDNLPLDTSLTATDKSYFQEDAKFYADGFPIEVHYNGSFLGIYIFRLKKSRENYKLDNSKKEHIFLEYDYKIAGGAYVLLKWQSFEPIQYELKSPKISGYVPGATITDTDVMNSINGLWSWTTAIYNNSGYVAHENKVILSAWIDYLIAVELANHWDGLNQNILLMTHDGVKWSPYIYDGDHTWGIEITMKRDSKTAFVLDYDARGGGENKTFWKNFRSIYLTQIKERYTELRRARVISIQEIEKTALDFSRTIDYEHYKKEFARWGYGLNPTTHGKLHLRHILTFANSSINFMDSRWLLPQQQ